jgi:restriction endonuclease S subunit
VLIPKKDKALLKYLEYAIRKLDLNQFWTNITQLTVPQLSSFEIPLPPLADQQKIVSEIEKIELQIDQLETELAQIPTQKEAILKKYL